MAAVLVVLARLMHVRSLRWWGLALLVLAAGRVFAADWWNPSTNIGITVVERSARISMKCIRAPAIQSILCAE